MSKNILLISVASFKELTSAHTNTDEKLIRPELKAAQDIKIRDLCGSELYDKLLSLVELRELSLDANKAYKDLLYDYLLDVLVNYTLAELPDATSYQFTNKGVVGKSGDGLVQLDETLLKVVKAKYQDRAEFYAARAVKYLEVNAAEKFKEYYEYRGPGATPPVKDTYTCPIPLGRRRGC